MNYENYAKKESGIVESKWLKLTKKVFGFETEFFVGKSNQPFSFDCNFESKKAKIGINNETLKYLGALAIVILIKFFYPKLYNEMMTKYAEQKNNREQKEVYEQ